MAVPTVPTATTLVTEGLKKAGYSSPASALITRAEDFYMPEIKNDIWSLAKKLKFLQTTSVLVLTEGRNRYSNPSDFSSDMEMTVLYGTHVGTATDGAVGSITLASDEDIDAESILGKEIVVTSGTGKSSMSQITAYSTSTKVATVTPDFATAPASSSGYMIIDTYDPVHQIPTWDFAKTNIQTKQGKPTHFVPMGDESYGEFILYPTPYISDSNVYVVRMRYYANLMTLDLAGTLIATLYSRWRNIWVQGVKAKQLEDDDDNRASREIQKYEGLLHGLIMREQYGMDLNNLNATISDYV